VESTVAGLAEEARPVSSGPGPARTDEEIQIVFDKYKATLYRMYNTELRKNPTLRGKIILRITIEPGGEISACTVQSNDLGSPELVARLWSVSRNSTSDRRRKFLRPPFCIRLISCPEARIRGWHRISEIEAGP
jgi:hypothetical protein